MRKLEKKHRATRSKSSFANSKDKFSLPLRTARKEEKREWGNCDKHKTGYLLQKRKRFQH